MKELIGTKCFFRGQEIFLESTGITEKDAINIELFNDLLYRHVRDLHELFSTDK